MKKKTLPLEIRTITEYKLSHIQEIKNELRRYKLDMMPSQTPSYSGMPGGGDPEARPMEDLAIKFATDCYIFEMERTIKAYDKVLSKTDKQDLKLIDMVYWKQSHTKEGAALACHMSKTAAYEHINTILCRLAEEMGYINVR